MGRCQDNPLELLLNTPLREGLDDPFSATKRDANPQVSEQPLSSDHQSPSSILRTVLVKASTVKGLCKKFTPAFNTP
jgi:hypothetical protein